MKKNLSLVISLVVVVILCVVGSRMRWVFQDRTALAIAAQKGYGDAEREKEAVYSLVGKVLYDERKFEKIGSGNGGHSRLVGTTFEVEATMNFTLPKLVSADDLQAITERLDSDPLVEDWRDQGPKFKEQREIHFFTSTDGSGFPKLEVTFRAATAKP